MKKYIEERVIEQCQYILDHTSTVRDTAKVFHVSKSSTHKDITVRVAEIDPDLHDQVAQLLAFNLVDRCNRGGLATKNRWLEMKECIGSCTMCKYAIYAEDAIDNNDFVCNLKEVL